MARTRRPRSVATVRRAVVVLLLAPVFAVLVRAAPRAEAGAGPYDPRDRMLFERAMRLSHAVAAKHVSPEGLLAYEHPRGGGPEALSRAALHHADTGIWTGCYAASVACRYAVTRDPAALAEARRIAAGLDLLSRATGVEGCVCRAVGRVPQDTLRGPHVASPAIPGLSYREDPSRDTLSGIVLGWDCLARYVDDPEVKALASRNLGAIARRLLAGGMQIRDVDGKVTTHGKLEPTIALGLVGVGEHAAIGLATVRAGLFWAGGQELLDGWKKLGKKGWVDAIDDQNAWIKAVHNTASDWNMIHMALVVLALDDDGKAKRQAMAALRDLRRNSRGWQNGSYLACALLAGQQVDRHETVAELRETLLRMPAEAGPFLGTRIVETSRLVPIERRPVNVWQWKQNPYKEEVGREFAVEDPTNTYTRADFLFAYWLARAAGELDPEPRGAAHPGEGPLLPPK
jgi:hypothetical protein